MRLFFLSLLLYLAPAYGATDVDDAYRDSLWVVGVGAGAVRFEHYPASDQLTTLGFPFPTYEYHGQVLRADKQDGTRAYLLKQDNWDLQFSGGIWAYLRSSADNARSGMQNDLPWMFELGPQLVNHLAENVELRLSLFQAVSTPDFNSAAPNGWTYEAYVERKWSIATGMFLRGRPINWDGNAGFSIKGASNEFLSTYFEVRTPDATPTRPVYDSRAGLLYYEVSSFSTLSWGAWNLYGGASVENYEISVNRASPLHRSDHNLLLLIGLARYFYASPRPSVPEQDAKGLLRELPGHLKL